MAGKRAGRRVRTLLRGAVAVLALLAIAALGLDLRLGEHLTRIEGVFDSLRSRPASGPGTTLLLLGTVSAGTSPAATVPWLPGAPALESVMLVQLTPDRRSVLVESVRLERTLVAEVTAAEPHRTIAAVEATTGRRIDHLVSIDWAVLERLADDNGTELTHRPGATSRHQHQFLRQMLGDTLHTEMRRKPWTLHQALDTVTPGMAVEAEWSLVEMSLLLVSLRDLRSADIEFRVA